MLGLTGSAQRSLMEPADLPEAASGSGWLLLGEELGGSPQGGLVRQQRLEERGAPGARCPGPLRRRSCPGAPRGGRRENDGARPA